MNQPHERSGAAIELGFGFDAYWSLGVAGLFGVIPWVAWLSPVFALMPERLDPFVSALLGGVIAFVVVVCPWLVPMLVLRSRQPASAQLQWDSEGVSTWVDGQQETVILWSRLKAGRVSWLVTTRQRQTPRRRVAIQLTDSEAPRSVITVWEAQPQEAPPARRRMANEDLSRLEHRVAEFTEGIDFARVADPARPRVAKWNLALMRLGYVMGTFAPLLGLAGLGLAVSASVVLLWRAWPVTRELATLRRARRRVSRGVVLELACRLAIVAAPVASTLLAAHPA